MSAPQPKPNLRALLSHADLFTLDFSPTDQDWEIYAALQNGLNHALKEQWKSYQAKPSQAIFQRYTTGTALHRNQCVCRDMTQLFHQFLQENPHLVHPYMYLIPGSFRYTFMDQNIPQAKMTMSLKYFIQWQGTLEELPPGLVELKEITRPQVQEGLTLASYYQLAKKTLKRLQIGPFDPTVRGYLKTLLPDFAKFEMGPFLDPAWLAEMTQLTNAKLAELGQPAYVAHASASATTTAASPEAAPAAAPAPQAQTLEDWAGYLYNGRKGLWPYVYIANLQHFATLTTPPTATTRTLANLGKLEFVSRSKQQAEMILNFNPDQHPKASFANISLEELAEKVYGDKEMKYLIWAANVEKLQNDEMIGGEPKALIFPCQIKMKEEVKNRLMLLAESFIELQRIAKVYLGDTEKWKQLWVLNHEFITGVGDPSSLNSDQKRKSQRVDICRLNTDHKEINKIEWIVDEFMYKPYFPPMKISQKQLAMQIYGSKRWEIAIQFANRNRKKRAEDFEMGELALIPDPGDQNISVHRKLQHKDFTLNLKNNTPTQAQNIRVEHSWVRTLLQLDESINQAGLIASFKAGPLGSQYDFAVSSSWALVKKHQGKRNKKQRQQLANAFRHALWVAVMTMESGPQAAVKIAKSHEIGMTFSEPNDTRVDMHNNYYGVLIGQTSSSKDEIIQKVEQAFLSNFLITSYQSD